VALNPQAYLEYVLTRIAEHPINQVSDFLPWNVAQKITADGKVAA